VTRKLLKWDAELLITFCLRIPQPCHPFVPYHIKMKVISDYYHAKYSKALLAQVASHCMIILSAYPVKLLAVRLILAVGSDTMSWSNMRRSDLDWQTLG
jgi:hypothetical protein